MNRTDAIAWVLSVCASHLRLSQAKTLSQLVAAAMRCERVSLAAIGRALAGTVKHQIKKAWRFCANDRVEVGDAMRGVIARLTKRRKKRLVVSFDWTDIRGFQTLVASAVFRGRSIPLLWASCNRHVYDGHRSRNAFEETLLMLLRGMLPPELKVILLADRGFGRTELGRFCQRHNIDYIIRVNPEVIVRSAGYSGKLLDYPVHRGICKLLRGVAYRGHDPLVQNVVIRWVRGLPRHRDECWFLMSNLDAGPARLSELYGRRTTIEELFRDEKNKRNGWSLRDTKISRPERLDRLLLILAIAYLLLCGIGLVALVSRHVREWSCSSRNDCSVFTIGRILLGRLRITAAQAIAAVIQATREVTPNWG